MDRIESVKVLDGSQRQGFESECGNIIIVLVIKPDKVLRAADGSHQGFQPMKFVCLLCVCVVCIHMYVQVHLLVPACAEARG